MRMTRRQHGVTIRQALIEAIGIAEQDITPEHEARMERVFRAQGLVPVTRVFGGIQLTVWVGSSASKPKGGKG